MADENMVHGDCVRCFRSFPVSAQHLCSCDALNMKNCLWDPLLNFERRNRRESGAVWRPAGLDLRWEGAGLCGEGSALRTGLDLLSPLVQICTTPSGEDSTLNASDFYWILFIWICAEFDALLCATNLLRFFCSKFKPWQARCYIYLF